MKRFFALAIALSFFLLSLPVSVRAIADDESDASFYLNYWVEEHTGINMKDIPVTAYGMSYADYIYRATGYTIDYWVDNATDPSNFVDNTEQYLYDVNYNNAELLKDLLSTIPITENTSQLYGTNYNQRVNQDGDINVSGSDYWNSVYNGLSQNGYNDQYASGESNGNSFNTNGVTCSISYIGYGRLSGNIITELSTYTNAECYSSYEPNVVNPYQFICSFTCNGNTGYFAFATINRNPWYDDICYGRTLGFINNDNNYYFNYQYQSAAGIFNKNASIIIYGTISNVTDNSTPILQDNQVGYVLKDGIKYSVYTDPSKNPFTINPDGTVSFPNDENTYPIYVDPDELSPEGDQYMIQYIINNYYGNDHNDFDPFSGNPNNRLNYPDSNIKDYSQGINAVLSWLKKIYNKECDVVKYLKQIAKGLPLNDSTNSDGENEDKFDTFESMLKLFNGKNNDGFKHKMLSKIGYAGITQNINNFGMALFGNRTFNDDGTVNTQFGSNSITETPTLYYTYAGVTHNFWNDLQLINENGDLTKAKEYVRFFIIFGFFLSLFRSLPSLINNAGGILSHASLAVPVDQSENSIELTEINQILADAPYPDEF